jgi:hypothetical protein
LGIVCVGASIRKLFDLEFLNLQKGVGFGFVSSNLVGYQHSLLVVAILPEMALVVLSGC